MLYHMYSHSHYLHSLKSLYLFHVNLSKIMQRFPRIQKSCIKTDPCLKYICIWMHFSIGIRVPTIMFWQWCCWIEGNTLRSLCKGMLFYEIFEWVPFYIKWIILCLVFFFPVKVKIDNYHSFPASWMWSGN